MCSIFNRFECAAYHDIQAKSNLHLCSAVQGKTLKNAAAHYLFQNEFKLSCIQKKLEKDPGIVPRVC